MIVYMRISFLVILLSILFYPAFTACAEEQLSDVQYGERLYREGLLSNGSPLKGYIKGDIEIDSSTFSCTNCHTRSGLGSVEGQVTSPAVNGSSLFNPRYQPKDQIKNSITKSKGGTRQAPLIRPAYTDETLAALLRGGFDPSGREMSPIMPRYNLSDNDMKHLVSYLHKLSSEYSPGVTSSTLTFATIVTDDVSEEDRQALLTSIDTLVTINKQTKTQRNLPQFAKMFRMLDAAFFREINVRVWELKGAPSTWPQQLENYYNKEPVFAILGGISNKPWQPIHEYCEKKQLPCLFPITDLPVISSTSWYTFYASKGYYQEGETAARHLNSLTNGVQQSSVLMLVRDTDQGDALAQGFSTTWHEITTGTLRVERLADKQQPNQVMLADIAKNITPDSVIIWDDAQSLSYLATVKAAFPHAKLVVSGRYMDNSISKIPLNLRKDTLITYPFRLPKDELAFSRYKDYLPLGKLKHNDNKRIVTRTFSMIHMFLAGLKELKLDFYRDTLIDVISMRPDQYLPDFERYSFGPGQRYASKGCYIVQIDTDNAFSLIKNSNWVIF